MNDQLIERWRSEGRIVSVCPEVEAGMSIPRKPAEIYNGSGESVLDGETEVVEKADTLFAALLRRHGVQVFSQHELAEANKAIHATSA